MTKQKDWATLSRADLQLELNGQNDDLQLINTELATMKRKGALGSYSPVHELQNLENRRGGVLARIRKLQALLSASKEKAKLHFSEFFMAAAEELIEDDDLYDRIYDKAEADFQEARNSR